MIPLGISLKEAQQPQIMSPAMMLSHGKAQIHHRVVLVLIRDQMKGQFHSLYFAHFSKNVLFCMFCMF